MSHFAGGKTLKRHSSREWIPMTAQIGELANRLSGRGDLVAYVGEDGGRGMAAALFDPAKSEVEVNTTAAFGKLKPKKIGDLTQRKVQFKHPKATGAIAHEAYHAKFTTWDLVMASKDLTPRENEAMHLLEEARIERMGADEQPENRSFLRSCALELILGDLDEEKLKAMSMTRQAAHMAALTLGRVDAGVLEEDDVKAIRTQIESVIKPDKLEEFRDIWMDFQAITQPSLGLERMYELARKWEKLVEDTAQENGEPSDEDIQKEIQKAIEEALNGQPQSGQGQQGQQGQSGSGDQEGEGEGDGQDGEGSGDAQQGQSQGQGGKGKMKVRVQFAEAAKEALGEDADATSINAQGDVNKQENKEAAAEAKAKRAAEGTEKAENGKMAKKIFGAPNPGPSNGQTNSRLIEERKPTTEERVAAVTIAQQLERAKYRDKDKTTVKTMLPPGRLRTRVAIQGEVLRQKGMDNTVEPWKQNRRATTDEPTFTLGMMTDISGSMGGAMEPMAVSNWVLSEATRRIQGRVGAVHYGNSVFHTLKPGTHLKDITVYSARDSSHNFHDAFQALDGELDLLYGTGARLLVICSDGQYGGYGWSSYNTGTDQSSAVDKWLRRCQAMGVGVLWIGFPDCNNGAAQDFCRKNGAEYVESTGTVTDAALKIGQAAARALTAAGARRQ